MKKTFPSIRSLKQGTRFKHFIDDNRYLVAIAGTKRSKHHRECSIEGQDGVFLVRSENTAELVTKSK